MYVHGSLDDGQTSLLFESSHPYEVYHKLHMQDEVVRYLCKQMVSRIIEIYRQSEIFGLCLQCTDKAAPMVPCMRFSETFVSDIVAWWYLWYGFRRA
jgi:hypothetical protein